MTFGRKNADVAEGVSIISDSLLITAIAFVVWSSTFPPAHRPPTARPQPLPTARTQPLPTARPQPLPTARPQPLPTARPQPLPTARPQPLCPAERLSAADLARAPANPFRQATSSSGGGEG
jgi:hypothetical protein